MDAKQRFGMDIWIAYRTTQALEALKHIEGPLGVRGRNSSNKLIFERLGLKLLSEKQ